MTIHFSDEQDDPLEPEPLVALATRVLAVEGFDVDTELEVTFVSETRIAQLNEEFMGRSGSTDVLAFPLETLHPGEVVARSAGGPPVNLGNVFISPAVVRRQAEATDVDYRDEMALMVAHGVLHLLGYDHHDDDDAELMEGRERLLLESVGRVRP